MSIMPPYTPRGKLTQGQRFNHRGENPPAICRSENLFTRPVRVGHHPEYVSSRVQDAGNVAQRAFGVSPRSDLPLECRVTKSDSVFCFHCSELISGTKVIAFHV